MDRRKFLRRLVGGLATAAAVRTFPFRVFSFPTEVEIANPFLTIEDLRAMEAMTPLNGFNPVAYIENDFVTRLEICAAFRLPPYLIDPRLCAV